MHHLDNTHAVEIVSLEPGGPVVGAGLCEGDLIVAVNDRASMSVDDLHGFLAEWPIGKPVRLTVLRGVECWACLYGPWSRLRDLRP